MADRPACPTCSTSDGAPTVCPACNRAPRLIWNGRLQRWVKLGGGATIAMALMACYGGPDMDGGRGPFQPEPDITKSNDRTTKATPDAKTPDAKTPDAKTPNGKEDPPPAKDEFALMSAETLGGLALDMEADKVIALIGKPTTKGKRQMEEATGETIQEWVYRDRGLTVSMSGAADKQTVGRLDAKAPSKLATSRGIAIGSPRADVEKAYGKERDETMSDAQTFIAGSIYGGVFFGFEGDVVVSIFIGAGAE